MKLAICKLNNHDGSLRMMMTVGCSMSSSLSNASNRHKI